MNKEKQPVAEWAKKREAAPNLNNAFGQRFGDGTRSELRVRDVIYWYIDYREVANVVKYRLAIVRKGIDEKIKQVSWFFTRELGPN